MHLQPVCSLGCLTVVFTVSGMVTPSWGSTVPPLFTKLWLWPTTRPCSFAQTGQDPPMRRHSIFLLVRLKVSRAMAPSSWTTSRSATLPALVSSHSPRRPLTAAARSPVDVSVTSFFNWLRLDRICRTVSASRYWLL